MWLGGKESVLQCRRHRKHGFDPGIGKILWRRKGQPTPVFLLVNPTDRGAYWAIVYGVTKSWTQLSMHTHDILKQIMWVHTK